MNKRTFSKEQVKALKQNPNVLEVKSNGVTYTPEFKVKAVEASLRGQNPLQIFKELGLFDLDIIGKDVPRKRIYNWKKIYDEHGEVGLYLNKRNSARQGGSFNDESAEEKLKKAEARIKFLETENEFLKKLEEQERQALRKKQD